jgi:hypothetical protein
MTVAAQRSTFSPAATSLKALVLQQPAFFAAPASSVRRRARQLQAIHDSS